MPAHYRPHPVIPIQKPKKRRFNQVFFVNTVNKIVCKNPTFITKHGKKKNNYSIVITFLRNQFHGDLIINLDKLTVFVP